jgi:hypothetical protein
MFEDMQMGYAAMRMLEERHGKCPAEGGVYAFAIDGTVTHVFTPEDEAEKTLYWSISKHVSGVNNILLVSPFGTVHAFRVAMPGNTPDANAAQAIFEWLMDPAVNPHNFGVLADYGFRQFCSCKAGHPFIVRPFMPTKDSPIIGKRERERVAQFSAWVCTCRQYNEWMNGSAKRGFPRWQMKTNVRYIKQLEQDLAMYLQLYNFRVRFCEWGQVRTTYLASALETFAEQNLMWDEVEGTFHAWQHAYVGPPDAEGVVGGGGGW